MTHNNHDGCNPYDPDHVEGKSPQQPDEYDARWGFVSTCPHGMIAVDHCDTCCVDIGDAERSMRFDWGQIVD